MNFKDIKECVKSRFSEGPSRSLICAGKVSDWRLSWIRVAKMTYTYTLYYIACLTLFQKFTIELNDKLEIGRPVKSSHKYEKKQESTEEHIIMCNVHPIHVLQQLYSSLTGP